MKVKQLLNSADKWCKFALARDKHNNVCDTESEKATQWCLQGAVYKCYKSSNKRDEIITKLNNLVNKIKPGVHGAVWFNDVSHTTFEDVKRLLNLANV